MTFKEWFYNAPHRAQYTKNHPTYFVAEEAWIAAHEACAKVCDVLAVHPKYASDITKVAAQAIRARGEK
jgi:hypothetical protein